MMDRRKFLISGATVAPAAGLTAFMAGATPHDPIPAWFDEWQKGRAAWSASEPDTPEETRLWDHVEAIERRILGTKPTSHEGMAAQLKFALESNLCGSEMGGDWAGMDRAMFEGIVEALRGGPV